MPILVTHPDHAILATVRQIAEAAGCTVTEPLPVDHDADARVDAYLAEHGPKRRARKLDASPEDTALALARRLAPGLEWTAPDDYWAEAPIAEGWARLTRDSRGRAYLTVLPGASGWRFFDDDPISPDLLDSARSHIIARCRDYLPPNRHVPPILDAYIASRVRGVQALLAGLEADPIPAEIRR